jgi:ParB-like chromosome segregation protein Spo0J
MSDTNTAPVTAFDEMSLGSIKGMAKDTGAKSADLWMIPYAELKIAPGFNIRDEDPAHIDWLADQMVARGYDKTRPMTGYVVKSEDGTTNQVYITDGHRRHKAVAKAIEKGAAIELVPVIIHPSGTSSEDLTLSLHNANSGKPLNPNELARLCQRLQSYGHDEKTIAAKLGYTVPYVKNLFTLLSAPKAVREMVASGKVSATLAVATVKKSGKDAAKILKDGMVAAEAKGKKKVTGKSLAPAAKKPKAPVPAPAAPAPTTGEPLTVEGQIGDMLEGIGSPDDHRDVIAFFTGAGLTQPTADRVHLAIVNCEKKTGLIKDLADYIRMVRVGDDAADLLARVDAALAGVDDDL